jgi:putative hydrolase of HD superfamily
MKKPESRSILEFYSNVLRLKRLRRSGWVRHGVKDPESVASHMYGVAVLSLLLSEGEKVDVEKVLKMSLIHDLPEAVAGDMTPHDKDYKRKRQIEEDALKRMVSCLPDNIAREIVGLNAELAAGRSPEARIVETADGLDMALTALEYGKSGANMAEFFDAGRKMRTGKGRHLLKYLKGIANSD